MLKARKIPVQTRSVAGYFYSLKNKRNIDFESQLEKKFFLSFEFDDSIEKYQEQPVKIDAILNGRKISYFPDCLVWFKPELNAVPLLIEIKYLKEIIEKKEKIANKARTVSAYARENGMTFKILTDRRVNETYMDNIKFLYRYWQKPKAADKYERRILSAVADGGLNVAGILDRISPVLMEKAEALPVIWHLVFTKRLAANLYLPLTNSAFLTACEPKEAGYALVP